MSLSSANPLSWEFHRQLRWQTFSNIANALVAAAYVLYVGRALGVEQFGVLAVTTAVATFTFSVVDFRLQEAVVRYFAVFADSAQARAAFLKLVLRVDLAARSGCWAIIVIGSYWLAKWLTRDTSLAPLFVVAASGAFAAKLGNGVAVGLLRARHLIAWHAKLLLLGWTCKLLATVLFIAIAGPTVLCVLIVASVCDAATNIVVLGKAASLAGREGLRWRKGNLQEMEHRVPEIRHFLLAGGCISLSDALVKELDTTIVAAFLSLPAVGVYRMAKYIVQLAWRAVDPLYVVLAPVFAKLVVDGDRAAIAAIARRVSIVSLGICVLIWLAACLVLPGLIPILLGEAFVSVAPLSILMLIGLICGAPLIWTHAYWIAAGTPQMQLLANVLAAGASALAYLVLTPRFAAQGAAISLALSLALPFLLSWLLWWRQASRPR